MAQPDDNKSAPGHAPHRHGTVRFTNVSLTLPQATEDAPRRDLLTNINLTLPAGSVTALLGRSGSGKTTLLRMVNGLARPTAGTIAIDGTDIAATNLLHLRHNIGYVIQETGLFPHMTIERNVGLPLQLAGPAPGQSKKEFTAQRRDRVHQVLDLVGLDPATFAARMPWQLSGGQRQRVGLARALATDSPQNPTLLLLLDEPFGALDPLTRAEMQTFLHHLFHRLKKTALIVTHDLQEALYLADRVLFIDAGKVIADLPSVEVETSTHPHIQAYRTAVHRTAQKQESAP